jgi:hypothetical protein
MSKVGKSVRAANRRAWQAEMIAKWGYGEYCEWPGGCSDRFGIANAHRLKKTKITTREEWVDGRAHLCQKHHDFAEMGDKDNKGTHERMWNIITAIIERREQ